MADKSSLDDSNQPQKVSFKPPVENHSFSSNIVFILGILIRVFCLSLGYDDHNDNTGSIKYTDIDYFVFTDAASYVLNGQSPYSRITYRYTPIMAYIVIPNHLVHPMFGKVLFAIIDMVVILLLRKILQAQYFQKAKKHQNLLDSIVALNPFVFIVSTRGSNDIIIGAVILAWVLLIIKKWYIAAGALYGLSVHLKIYPIIYVFPLLLIIDSDNSKDSRLSTLWNPVKWFTVRKIKFFGAAAIVFFGLGYLFYHMYGFQFIYESYIYHSLRVDHRHNFSFNYYFEYFHYDELPENKHLVRKLSFVAQWGLVSFVGIRYNIIYESIKSHVSFNNFLCSIGIQTYIFVMFNRVITAQYFVWFMILMPLVVINIDEMLKVKNLFIIFTIFLISELLVNLS